MRLAAPVILTYVATFCIPLATVVIGGRLGTPQLAALALGTMTVNVTGISVAIGLLSGLDTLASQAFGAGELRQTGVLLQRGLLVGGMACAPIITFWVGGVGPLLVLVGQPAEVAALAEVYARVVAAGLPGMVLFEAVKRWLQCQQIVSPMLYTACAVLPLHVALCWALVYPLGMGYEGAAAATALSYWLLPAVLLLGLWRCPPHAPATWPGLSSEALSELGAYMRLAVPGMLMFTLEW